MRQVKSVLPKFVMRSKLNPTLSATQSEVQRNKSAWVALEIPRNGRNFAIVARSSESSYWILPACCFGLPLQTIRIGGISGRLLLSTSPR